MEIGVLCALAKVSRSGYYRWCKLIECPDRDHEDYVLIKSIFDKGKKKYGFRSIRMKLEAQQIVMNHKKIIRIMKKYHLRTKVRRINPYKMIMKKSLEHRTFENVLARNFTTTIPHTVLCTDITYVPYNHRIAYLSVIKDIASHEVIAWNLSSHIDMDIVLDTLVQLKTMGNFTTAIIHSDQGVHYTHPTYSAMVKDLGMIQSMSRKGNCIDNAPIESFFGHFKDDVDYKACTTFAQLHAAIAEYMPYYNNERHQWGLKKMTPAGYRDHLLLSTT